MKIRLERFDSEQRYRLLDASGAPILKAQEFFQMLVLKGLSVHTLRAYGYDLVALYRWLQSVEKDLEEIDSRDLLAFIAAQKAQGIGPRSINRRLTTAYVYYRFCTGREIAQVVGALPPRAHYKGRGRGYLGLHQLPSRSNRHLQVKVPRTLVEPLTKAQVSTFISTLSRYRDLCIVYLMLLCGLRSQELRELRLTDVCLEEQRVRVRGKGDKERMLPLPEVLVSYIECYLHFERPAESASAYLFVVLQGKRRGEKLSAEGLRSLFRQRRKNTALSNANPHRLRHTFGADMARAGIDIPVLQRLMGHEDLRTTLLYINLSMADVAKEFRIAAKALHEHYKGSK